MTFQNLPYDYIIKLLLIGNSGVGKSSILLKFSEDDFTSSFITTIGIDFRIRTITIDGKKYKLQIWDTAGHERFRTLTTAYFRSANGILLVYDITNEKSFNDVRNWINNIKNHTTSDIKILLIGNKCDILDNKIISTEQGQLLADEYDIPFLETSAKNSINIENAFISLVKDIRDGFSKKDIVYYPRFDSNLHPSTKNKNCCNII